MSVGFTTRPPSRWTLSRCCRGKSGQSTTDVVGSNWRSASRPKRTPPLLNHLPSRIPFSGADSTHFRFCITTYYPLLSFSFSSFIPYIIHNFFAHKVMSSLTLSSNLNMENVFPDPVHQQIFSHLSPRRGELPIHVVETIAGAFALFPLLPLFPILTSFPPSFRPVLPKRAEEKGGAE